jgi:hypothetical protein
VRIEHDLRLFEVDRDEVPLRRLEELAIPNVPGIVPVRRHPATHRGHELDLTLARDRKREVYAQHGFDFSRRHPAGLECT